MALFRKTADDVVKMIGKLSDEEYEKLLDFLADKEPAGKSAVAEVVAEEEAVEPEESGKETGEPETAESAETAEEEAPEEAVAEEETTETEKTEEEAPGDEKAEEPAEEEAPEEEKAETKVDSEVKDDYVDIIKSQAARLTAAEEKLAQLEGKIMEIEIARENAKKAHEDFGVGQAVPTGGRDDGYSDALYAYAGKNYKKYL